MGSPQSSPLESGQQELPQQIFVMNNGIYQPQQWAVAGTASSTQPPPIRHQPAKVMDAKVVTNPVNMQKNTLKLIFDEKEELYYLSFDFDAALPCTLTVRFGVLETIDSHTNTQNFEQMDPSRPMYDPETFPAKLKQSYQSNRRQATDLTAHLGDFVGSNDDDIIYLFPIVIELKVDGSENKRQFTYGTFMLDDAKRWKIQVIKQKVQLGQCTREIREIFGSGRKQGSSEVTEEEILNGRECVICLAAERDTAVVPCRHMCLCQDCANILRLQSNKCPICREPVSSLLRIKNTAQKPQLLPS
eukprot:Platyproteum_vivax@DN6638_c0_g1_i1.p1